MKSLLSDPSSLIPTSFNGSRTRYYLPWTIVAVKHNLEAKHGIGRDCAILGSTISQLVWDIHLPMVADVHIEHGCGKTIYPATCQIGSYLSSSLVVGTLEGLIEYITCRISISAQQSTKIAHLHRIGVHRASAALALSKT